MAFFRRKSDPDAPRLGIYIHIPFCVRKCDYCDFTSFPVGTARMDEYLHALRCILRRAPAGGALYGQYDLFRRRDSTFLAPSGWPHLLQIVRKQFNVSKDCEITVECNPDSADQDTLLTLKKAESTACLWGTIRAGQGTGGNRPGTQLAQATQAFSARQRRGFRQYFAGSHLWSA